MYDLELDKVAKEIKDKKAKQVIIQLPDGLKLKTQEIVNYLEKNTKAQIFIWLSSTFGACDFPLGLDNLNIDLMIQWGHNRFYKEIW